MHCRIIFSLNADERGLFKEHIKILDKKIYPGLTKLNWASKGISDFYISDCRLTANKIQAKVDDYKSANLTIASNCVEISQLALVDIDPRKIYEDLEFGECQVKILSIGHGNLRAKVILKKWYPYLLTSDYMSTETWIYYGQLKNYLSSPSRNLFFILLSIKISLFPNLFHYSLWNLCPRILAIDVLTPISIFEGWLKSS